MHAEINLGNVQIKLFLICKENTNYSTLHLNVNGDKLYKNIRKFCHNDIALPNVF